uniref:Uncharacterized protein n=1 Tax=Ulva partita TaxID=1605170 RepID=A0A1C9ZS51_9CHLO|nr:hypothetical protein [Ulva partita]
MPRSTSVLLWLVSQSRRTRTSGSAPLSMTWDTRGVTMPLAFRDATSRGEPLPASAAGAAPSSPCCRLDSDALSRDRVSVCARLRDASEGGCLAAGRSTDSSRLSDSGVGSSSSSGIATNGRLGAMMWGLECKAFNAVDPPSFATRRGSIGASSVGLATAS